MGPNPSTNLHRYQLLLCAFVSTAILLILAIIINEEDQASKVIVQDNVAFNHTERIVTIQNKIQENNNSTENTKKEENNEAEKDKEKKQINEKSFLEEREQVYKKRQQLIEETCEYYKANDPHTFRRVSRPKMFYFTKSLEYRLLWTRVAKAGTCSWVYNFHMLKNHTQLKVKTHGLSESHVGLWKSLKEDGFFSFTFSRHPFSRILSVYLNKFEDSTRVKGGAPFFYQHYGKSIVSKYRSQEDQERINKKECTFPEFVQYIIDGGAIRNQHWRPASMLIYPCSLPYDVPGKLESFTDDSNYVIIKNNLQNFIEVSWFNNNTKESDPRKLYYANITRKQLDLLYEKYEPDFRLFGYDPSEYYTFVKD